MFFRQLHQINTKVGWPFSSHDLDDDKGKLRADINWVKTKSRCLHKSKDPQYNKSDCFTTLDKGHVENYLLAESENILNWENGFGIYPVCIDVCVGLAVVLPSARANIRKQSGTMSFATSIKRKETMNFFCT